MAEVPPRPLRLTEIQQAIGGEIIGEDAAIGGVSNLELAEPDHLAFVSADRYLPAALKSRARAFVVARHFPELRRPQLIVSDPAYAFARLVQRYFAPAPPARGLAAEVARGRDVRIGPDAGIGSFVTLGDRVVLGARVTLYPGVYLGDDVEVGDDSVLYPHVAVMSRCRIGRRVIIHAGTVIGSDGFGYVHHEGRHHKVPQVGTVDIEDDVELGANVAVDRATFGRTVIKRGTKIDNLVQVAHNVTVGEDCILVAQVGIAGSTTLGHHVVIGGQAGVSDHLTLGDGAMLAARSGAIRDVAPGQIVSGNPAFAHDQSLRAHFLIPRLPELRQQLKELTERVAALEGKRAKAKRSTKKR